MHRWAFLWIRQDYRLPITSCVQQTYNLWLPIATCTSDFIYRLWQTNRSLRTLLVVLLLPILQKTDANTGRQAGRQGTTGTVGRTGRRGRTGRSGRPDRSGGTGRSGRPDRPDLTGGEGRPGWLRGASRKGVCSIHLLSKHLRCYSSTNKKNAAAVYKLIFINQQQFTTLLGFSWFTLKCLICLFWESIVSYIISP